MKRVALIGANGMLATAIKKLAPADFSIQPYDLPGFDITDRKQVLSLQELSPDVIINCAAYTNVDGCEDQCDQAMQVNGVGPGLLAELAKTVDAVLLHISTDFIFDGEKNSPYLEDDQPQPLSVYGKSKFAGEQQIEQSGIRKFFIVRTSWLYGTGGSNFVETMIRLAKEKTELKVVADQRGTPTWTDDLARAIFTLLQTEGYGIYHFSNQGECSWYEFARKIVEQIDKTEELTVKKILPIPTEGYPLPAVRPKNSVLSKQKILQFTAIDIPAWQQSLESYISQR
ncbi:dTDP-4-dehydrorhamnose reductase [Deltaproteobacteria bacterium]|nr:dTDP-4-dehydrorhamnose reductase [Deltaproteobacteria bacterium]